MEPEINQTTDRIQSTYDYCKIEEGLFLGNLTAAADIDTLKLLQISHIVTVESSSLPSSICSITGLHVLFIEVYDMANENLLSHFPKIIDFISAGQEKGNVLVHCYQGVSRSACVVIAFLMKKYNIDLNSAMQRVKSKKKDIMPNSGFLSQLQLFRNINYSLTIKNSSFRLFKLVSSKDKELIKSKRYNTYTSDSVYENISEKESTPYVKCKSCRTVLLYEDSVILHQKGIVPKWDCPSYQNVEIIPCNLGIFTLPYKWMKNLSSCEGKLHCYKCNQKIGSFDWIKGYTCPCSVLISPGFLIIVSKIDFCKNIYKNIN